MTKIRRIVKKKPYKVGRSVRRVYEVERFILEFPRWFMDQMRDFVDREVDLQRSGDSIIIRLKGSS